MDIKFADLPEFVQKEMLNEQESQGNKRDPSVFHGYVVRDSEYGGFDWRRSKVGYNAWKDILLRGSKDYSELFSNKHIDLWI